MNIDHTLNNIKFIVSGFQLKLIRYANKQEILMQNQKKDQCIEKDQQVK